MQGHRCGEKPWQVLLSNQGCGSNRLHPANKKSVKQKIMSEEIIKTRIGGLGSSDANMVYQIGKNGFVNESQKQRLAIMLRLAEQKQFSTNATEYGKYIEDCIYEHIKKNFTSVISNPFYKSECLSNRYNFGVFNHIDYEYETENVIYWFECKAVNSGVEETIEKYKNQLSWHEMLLAEKAQNSGKNHLLYIVHYQTDDKVSDFDYMKLSILPLNKNNIFVDFSSGLQIISNTIKDFEYNQQEELSSYQLPANVQDGLSDMYIQMKQIEETEKKLEQFRENMLRIMSDNGVKSIDNEYFRLTVVPQSESTQFDSKKFQAENPDLSAKYQKKQTKKSYLKITLK